MHRSTLAAMAALGLSVLPLAARADDMTIDTTTLTPDVAQTFAKAKTLAMPVTIELDVRTADALEKIGHYEVDVDRQAGAQGNVLLDSERRTMLRKLCKSNPDADIALSIGYQNTGNSGVAGAFLGHVNVDFNWTLYYVDCKSAAFNQFGGTYVHKQGIYSVSSNSQTSTLMANNMVTHLVAAFGR